MYKSDILKGKEKMRIYYEDKAMVEYSLHHCSFDPTDEYYWGSTIIDHYIQTMPPSTNTMPDEFNQRETAPIVKLTLEDDDEVLFPQGEPSAPPLSAFLYPVTFGILFQEDKLREKQRKKRESIQNQHQIFGRIKRCFLVLSSAFNIRRSPRESFERKTHKTQFPLCAQNIPESRQRHALALLLFEPELGFRFHSPTNISLLLRRSRSRSLLLSHHLRGSRSSSRTISFSDGPAFDFVEIDMETNSLLLL
ncbi:hypothetical protein Fmac_033053 [Flemingia macrophylla]|uniref:Uncharacterized protein n=1 Tax=Flemingia macrophylla TaxID=520843 RepID=A0ABD1L6N7_9FABA